MYLVRANAHTMNSIPFFEKGYYWGSNIVNIETPLDVIFLKNNEEDAHHIENIKDIAIVIPMADILYDRQHLAYLLFVLKEKQHNESEPVKLIKNLSIGWLNTGCVEIYPQDQPKKAYRKSGGATDRTQNEIVNMNNYLPKEIVLGSVSALDHGLVSLARELLVNAEEEPSLYYTGHEVDGLFDDVHDFISHLNVGEFTLLDDYLKKHPHQYNKSSCCSTETPQRQEGGNSNGSVLTPPNEKDVKTHDNEVLPNSD
jgi:hypothetical protein